MQAAHCSRTLQHSVCASQCADYQYCGYRTRHRRHLATSKAPHQQLSRLNELPQSLGAPRSVHCALPEMKDLSPQIQVPGEVKLICLSVGPTPLLPCSSVLADGCPLWAKKTGAHKLTPAGLYASVVESGTGETSIDGGLCVIFGGSTAPQNAAQTLRGESR